MAEKQRVLAIREQRLIQKQSLPKLGTFIRNGTIQEAYYCLREYMNIVKGKGWNKAYWLLIDERFAMCMSPYQNRLLPSDRLQELTNQDIVADQSFNLTRNQTDFQQHKTRYYDFMGMAVMGAVIAVVIIAMLAMKGKLNLGQLFGGG